MAVIAGFVATELATQAVTRPIRDMRQAVDRVGRAISRPPSRSTTAARSAGCRPGSTRWSSGLREREQPARPVRPQVGSSARPALENGGTWRPADEISALFVDVIGSTSLAEREPPERVVALLNEFFAAVVASSTDGGLVNKFEGDAALCVFGAPGRAARPRRPGARRRPRAAERPDAGRGLDAAIGVAAGRAVAGYVGAETRFEYTVSATRSTRRPGSPRSPSERPAGCWRAPTRSTRAGRSEADPLVRRRRGHPLGAAAARLRAWPARSATASWV